MGYFRHAIGTAVLHLLTAMIVFHKKTENILISNGILNQIAMQAVAEHLFGRMTINCILCKNWSSGKSEYLGIIEELHNLLMTLPEMATMALIEYHHDTRMAYRIYFAAIPCLAYGCIEFLNSGNDNLGVAMQTFYQLVRIVRTVNGSRFKGFIFRLCLCIKVMAVDNEHYLIYII